MRRKSVTLLLATLLAASTSVAAQTPLSRALPQGQVMHEAQLSRLPEAVARTIRMPQKQVGTPFVTNTVRDAFTRARLEAAAKKTPLWHAPLADDGAPWYYYGLSGADNWPTSYVPYGIYKFSTLTPSEGEEVLLTSQTWVNGGGTLTKDGIYVFTNIDPSSVYLTYNYKYDTTKDPWERIDFIYGTSVTVWASDIGYDQTSDEIYGCFYDEDLEGMHWGILDTYGWKSSTIKSYSLEERMLGVAATRDGQFYGININSEFVKIDKETGDYTVISTIEGLNQQYSSSAAIEPRTNIFYYVEICDIESYLWAVDITTGEAERLYQFPNNEYGGGMAFEPVVAEDNAPAKPEINSIEHDGTSLEGKVRFTTPTTLYDGSTPPEGSTLKYEILARKLVTDEPEEDEPAGLPLRRIGVSGSEYVVATGSNLDWGKTYLVPFKVSESGMYRVSLYVYLDNSLASPEAHVRYYIGEDTPVDVTNVLLTWDDTGKTELTWNAPTIGVNDGSLADLTYNIYDAEGTQVATGITATSWSTTVPEPNHLEELSFYVQAVAAGRTSGMVQSNIVPIGRMDAPLFDDFQGGMHYPYTIIDANGDGTSNTQTSSTWNWYDYGNGRNYMRYRYHSRNAGDDWFISPAINVEAGKMYIVRMDISGYNTRNVEKYKVYFGKSATVEGMTDLLIEEDITWGGEWQTKEFRYIAQEDGKFYVGVYDCSEKNKYYVQLDNLYIGPGVIPGAPMAPENVVVTPDIDAQHKAVVTFTTPTLDVDNAAITALTQAVVKVDGTVAATISAPVPGQEYTAEVNVDGDGIHTFEVSAYNDKGEGFITRSEEHVGMSVPGGATNAKLIQTTPGSLDLTWDAPTVDARGRTIDPAKTHYAVVYVDGNGELAFLTQDTQATEIRDITMQIPAEGQGVMQFGILAYNAIGESSELAVTNFAAVGHPYTTVFYENFPGTSAYGGLVVESVGAQWALVDDTYFVDVKSRNLDGGFAAMQASAIGQQSTLVTGWITIGEGHTELSFFTYGFGDAEDVDTNTITVAWTDQTGSGEIGVTDVKGSGWMRRTMDVSSLVGKTVQLRFTGTAVLRPWTTIDDIRIGEPIEWDLNAASLTGPTNVLTEQPFALDYTISNMSIADLAAGTYTVSLTANGETVATVEGPAVKAGATATGTFSRPAFSLFEAGIYDFALKANLNVDQDATNNLSAPLRMKVSNTEYPAVALDGTFEAEGGNVALAWETPAIDITDVPASQNFGSFNHGATTGLGGFTSLTQNTAPVNNVLAQLQITFPVDNFGWILVDMAQTGLGADNGMVEGVDDNKFMLSLPHTEGTADAWLISPNLGGVAQTFTFYATGLLSPEKVQVWTSTTDANPASFTQATFTDGTQEITTDYMNWQQYSVELPAGTQYAAIVSQVEGSSYGLMVDNIDYVQASPFATLALTGYDLYRNGTVMEQGSLLQVNTWAETLVEPGEYTYHVVARYNNGKSAPSNPFSATVEEKQSGIESIDAAAAAQLEIYNLMGIRVYNPQPGQIYIVRTADAVSKILVR